MIEFISSSFALFLVTINIDNFIIYYTFYSNFIYISKININIGINDIDLCKNRVNTNLFKLIFY